MFLHFFSKIKDERQKKRLHIRSGTSGGGPADGPSGRKTSRLFSRLQGSLRIRRAAPTARRQGDEEPRYG
jgi:hypothetical protein